AWRWRIVGRIASGVRTTARGDSRDGAHRSKRGEVALASGFLFGEFEGHVDIAAGIETGNGPRRRYQIAMLSMEFVIHVGIEAAEAVVAGVVSDISLHCLRPDVFQIDDA